jgi:two-component system response regulator AtoC
MTLPTSSDPPKASRVPVDDGAMEEVKLDLDGDEDTGLVVPGTRVLVVDDDAPVRTTLRRVLADRGFEVVVAEDSEQALAVLASGKIDVMLLDIVLPKVSGMEILQIARQRYPDTEVVMMTGHGDVDTAVRAVKHGAYDFLTKPFPTINSVAMSITKAAEHRRLVGRMRQLEWQLEHQELFGDMVGSSAVMQQVYRMALGVATTNASVLIQGESGTGKELVAREVHRQSGRKGAFQAINCAALPAQLIESELFGYRRGAFTGAHTDKTGLVRAAHGGTLFLDEIGDMPIEAQAKLLRVLQEREVTPLGATQAERIDVRVVCATHRDLDALVAEGRFRGDLLARLRDFTATLPPLRERREDVYRLVRHFLARAGRPDVRVSFQFMLAVAHYGWPYNVRELESAVKVALAVADGPELDLAHLPEQVRQSVDAHARRVASAPLTGAPDTARLAAGAPADGSSSTRGPSEAALRALLAEHKGNIAAVGRELGKERMQVHRYLKRYGIDIDDYRD